MAAYKAKHVEIAEEAKRKSKGRVDREKGKPSSELAQDKLAQNAQTTEVEAILGLQQTLGNASVQRLLKSRTVQAKLTVNPPDDQYEKEADNVAAAFAQKSNSQMQRQSAEDEEKIQTKAATGSVPDVTDDLEVRIHAARGAGRPLPESLRTSLEPQLGHDFSQVRLHTDAEADKLSGELQAKAFTTGKDVFFAEGTYQPDSESGKSLIGHEMAHVVQQGAATVYRAEADTKEKSTTEPRQQTPVEPKQEAAEQVGQFAKQIKTDLQRQYMIGLWRWSATCAKNGDEAAARDAMDAAATVALDILKRKIKTFDVGAAKEEMVRDLLMASRDAQALSADPKASENALRKVTIWAENQLSAAMQRLKKEPTEENVRDVLKRGSTVGLLAGDQKLIEASLQQVREWAEKELAEAMEKMKKAPTQGNVRDVLKIAREVELLGGDSRQETNAALEAARAEPGQKSGNAQKRAASK